VLNKKAQEALTQEAGPALEPPPVAQTRRVPLELTPQVAPGSGADGRMRPSSTSGN
jgi:hypothetical protein